MTVKKEIIVRFGFVYALAVLIMIPILFSAGKTIFTEGDFWRSQGAKSKIDSMIVKPNRGNILATDGKLLASSVPSYRLYIDFRADGLNQNILNQYVDSLTYALSFIYYKEDSKNKKGYSRKGVQRELRRSILEGCRKKENNFLSLKNQEVSYEEYRQIKQFPVIYKDAKLYIELDVLEKEALNHYMKSVSTCLAHVYTKKSPKEMESHLWEGYKKRDRRYSLGTQEVSYIELKQINENPFFSKGSNRSGLIAEDRARRKKPFDRLASRTIGGLYGVKEGGRGNSGLEMHYEAFLRGEPGISSRQKIAGRFRTVNQIDPVDGFDIRTTIDVNIQDITETALLNELQRVDAERGCAVVMEVKTGRIRAISNLERGKDGRYRETRNFAVSSQTEPGSTFKIASVMVALDDGVIDTSYKVNTENGIWKIGGEYMRDHNWNKGGLGTISIAQSIWHSSNIGISKVIQEFYRDKPERFVERLYAMRLNEPIDLEIPGAGRPKIKHPSDPAAQWSGITLPWMSIGYETQIPPIYTLTFYNAIANNGRMIKPIFVEAISRNGSDVRQFSTEVINPSICSPNTLKKVNQMLIDVVEKGTAEAARSNNFQIAGKTGTAQVDYWKKDNTKTHQLTFAGYFPADDPKYSCIVVVWSPKNAAPSAGNICGSVFKNIAERIYAQSPLLQSEPKKVCDAVRVEMPVTKDGKRKELQLVLDKLGIPHTFSGEESEEWIFSEVRKDTINMRVQKIRTNIVPNTIGMGARDAIYLLENKGLRVRIAGRGKVEKQSIASGTLIKKGDIIQLELK